MASGATLEELLLGVRAEAMQSVNANFGVAAQAVYAEMIRRMQRQMWMDFAWPHMRVRRDIHLAAGQRYYDFPADLDVDRVDTVEVFWGSSWFPVSRGIGEAEYNTWNSDVGIRADPARRWDLVDVGSGMQMEVWPVPASGHQRMRFRGIRHLRPLVDMKDQCDMDPDMLVLYVAAQIAAENKSPRAQSIADRGRALYSRLKGRYSESTGGGFVLGGVMHDSGRGDWRRRRGPLVATDIRPTNPPHGGHDVPGGDNGGSPGPGDITDWPNELGRFILGHSELS